MLVLRQLSVGARGQTRALWARLENLGRAAVEVSLRAASLAHALGARATAHPPGPAQAVAAAEARGQALRRTADGARQARRLSCMGNANLLWEGGAKLLWEGGAENRLACQSRRRRWRRRRMPGSGRRGRRSAGGGRRRRRAAGWPSRSRLARGESVIKYTFFLE